MKENITQFRPLLSGKQASDISELISGHEEVIEARKRLVLDRQEPPVPEHRTLLPDDYRVFCPSGGNQVVKALMRGSKTLAAVSAILVILAALLACRE